MQVARAQPTAQDPIAAEALFTEGRALAKKGDFAAACPKFAESFRLDPAPGTLLNLADCEEATGKIASAWLHYRQVAEMFPKTDDRIAYAKQRVVALEPHMPKLTIDVPSNVPNDTVILRNGVVLGTASYGTPLPLDPGVHVIIVKAPGRLDRRYVVEVGADQKQSVQVDVGELANKASSPSDSSSWWGPRRTAGVVIGAVGVAAIAAGSVTGVMVIDRKKSLRDHCDAQNRCDTEGVQLAQEGRTLSAVSTITMITGAVALATGITLVATGSGVPASSASSRYTPRLDTTISRGEASLWLTGAF
ncbi:MAG: hypothetical protein U0165_13430 [Polyangiaceae bacterium]